jgi:hypothetical protein
MRDIKKCVLLCPDTFEVLQYELKPSPCSYPEEEKCGSYVKTIRRKERKTAITFCKYQEKNREV